MTAVATPDLWGSSQLDVDLNALADIYDPQPHPYMHRPSEWVRDHLQAFLWSKQREILESVEANRYTAVQSCHDSGKSFTAAQAVCWWLATRPLGEAFAVTTAPTWNQVHAILWREIRKARSRGELPGRTTLDARWYMGGKTIGDEDEQLVAYGRKPSDYDQDGFQGIHAKYVLIVIDEACGVPKLLYDAVDTLATNEHARVLAIGNPDDPGSHFHKVCKPGSGWNRIAISAFDTPNFTDEAVPEELNDLMLAPTWVEERKKRWGVTSPTYVSKVLGQFPDISDDTLLSPAMLRKAMELELPGSVPGQFGADVARMGVDETVVYRNRGGQVRLAYVGSQQTTTETTGAFAKLMKGRGRVPMHVDAVGVGAGVYDNLVDQGHPAIEYQSGWAAIDSKRFVNRRAEDYWLLREACEAGEVDLPDETEDEDLIAQLGSIKWALDSKGRIKIESKDDMRKRGLPSPDRADACIMSFSRNGGIMLPSRTKKAAQRRAAKRRKATRGITGDLHKKEM
jgi:hypothetical protein